jgi:cell wall-associated protease
VIGFSAVPIILRIQNHFIMKKYTFTLFTLLFATSVSFAQKKAPENWFNLDLKKDKVPGVSSERAYSELLNNKTSTQIIVAVIDGGTEVDHEDLKGIIWTNTNEIAGNGLDDDNNGYIDDIHGWNFIGGKNGDVDKDNLELARVYKELTDKYKETDPKAGKELDYYLLVKADYERTKKRATAMSRSYTEIIKNIDSITNALGTKTPTESQLKQYKTTATDMQKKCMDIAHQNNLSLGNLRDELQKAVTHYTTQVEVNLNTDFDSRSIVGDNYSDINERIYGNNNYEGPEGDHGTHVAGIIAAMRGNNLGIKGVANNVQIMVVRVVPSGDERDKDVANGIRYAVDNGAKIINMSFGKNYSPGKSAVDEAVKYAVSKNVLLVHAAGNDSKNKDIIGNYPHNTH